MAIKWNEKLIGSAFIGVVLYIGQIIFAYNLRTDFKDFAFSMLIVVAGTSIGWLTGMFISPYSQEENKQFSTVVKAVSAFISGYILGKIDPLIEAFLSPEFVFDVHKISRLLLLVSSLVIAMIYTFIFRKYAVLKK